MRNISIDFPFIRRALNRLRWFILLALLTGLGACKKVVTEVDSRKIPDFERATYLEDARQLYVREIASNPGHPNYNVAEIDPAGIERYLNLLELIYDLKTAQTDSVFNIHKIHTFPTLRYDVVSLDVNGTAPEIVNLSKNTFPTGDSNIDKIFADYKLSSVGKLLTISGQSFIDLKFQEKYNLISICAALRKSPSIIKAVPASFGGDGNNIVVKIEGAKTIVDFSSGSGDCYAGCINRKHWFFIVEGNKVTFSGWKIGK